MRPNVKNWWTPPSQTTMRHKLVIAVPMGLLNIIDSIIMVATLGFLQPGLSLDWAFFASKWSGPSPYDHQEEDDDDAVL